MDAAAYRSNGVLYDERVGKAFAYPHKNDCTEARIMAPNNAPRWAHNRESLWNRLESVERRRDAQLAREIEICIPRELVDTQAGREAWQAFVQREVVALGAIADVTVHRKRARDGGLNEHLHVMFPMRSLDPATPSGLGWRRLDWNKRSLVRHWRKQWANYANAALEEVHESARVDHRSLGEQLNEAEFRVIDELEYAMENRQDPEMNPSFLRKRAKMVECSRPPIKGRPARREVSDGQSRAAADARRERARKLKMAEIDRKRADICEYNQKWFSVLANAIVFASREVGAWEQDSDCQPCAKPVASRDALAKAGGGRSLNHTGSDGDFHHTSSRTAAPATPPKFTRDVGADPSVHQRSIWVADVVRGTRAVDEVWPHRTAATAGGGDRGQQIVESSADGEHDEANLPDDTGNCADTGDDEAPGFVLEDDSEMAGPEP